MKIRVLSDLHLEFNEDYQYNYAGEDLIVLAGDIVVDFEMEELLSQMPSEIPILYVAGNHEYYRKPVELMHRYFRELEELFKNFHWLNDEPIDIDGVRFFGGTMFTSMEPVESFDSVPVDHFKVMVERWVGDFLLTRLEDGSKWTPQHHIEAHEEFHRKLRDWVYQAQDGIKPRVVISHFIPTPQHIHPRFASNVINRYFVSDMEQYSGLVDLWIHGHGHDRFDSVINDTRFVSNPLGYPLENTLFENDLIVEVKRVDYGE